MNTLNPVDVVGYSLERAEHLLLGQGFTWILVKTRPSVDKIELTENDWYVLRQKLLHKTCYELVIAARIQPV